MAEKLVIELTREKETPGTVRFQEQDPDEDPKVGTLYVLPARLAPWQPRGQA